MTNEETIKPEESFSIINNMINAAKNKLADDGFFLIFWGWLVTITALAHYLSIKLGIENGFLVWPVLMPLGGVFSLVYGYLKGKKSKVKTYIDTYLAYLWGGFGICLAITLAFLPFHGVKSSYFFLMLLYGLSTFVSGGLLNFRPLVFGGILSMAFAVLSVFLGEIDQLWCLAAALFCSYIVPGHMLRSKYKSQSV